MSQTPSIWFQIRDFQRDRNYLQEQVVHMFTHLMIWYFNFISVESPDQMLVGVGDLKDAVHFSALNIFRPVVLTDSVLYENSFYCLKLSIVWLYPWRTSEAKSLPQIILISHSRVFVSFGFCVEQGSIGNVTGELLSSEFIWHMVNRIKIAIENMANLPSFFVCFAHQCPPPNKTFSSKLRKYALLTHKPSSKLAVERELMKEY